jgi:molecular chaperone GrpE
MKKKKKEKGKKNIMAEEEKKTEEVKENAEPVAEKDEEVVEAEDVETVEKESDELSEVDTLKAKVAELEETVARMKDDDLRRAAETENYRKRLRTEKENAVKYANESLISDLLEPLDNFARAIDAAETTSDVESLRKGVVMVKDHLLQVLRQNWGLEMIESAPGTAYDPNTMEAYGVQEKEGIGKEEVAMECAKGWLLHGKVLRTAKVFVAKPKN